MTYREQGDRPVYVESETTEETVARLRKMAADRDLAEKIATIQAGANKWRKRAFIASLVACVVSFLMCCTGISTIYVAVPFIWAISSALHYYAWRAYRPTS